MADGDLRFIPTDPDNPYPLGRSVQWHDRRNRQHRALDTAGPTPPARKSPWFTTTVFSQESDNCTAEAAVGLLRTQPNRQLRDGVNRLLYDEERERIALYRRAQYVDPWDGPPPDYAGTSTDAPFRVLRDDGIIPAWKWLFGFDELQHWVRHYGPAVVGTVWFTSMFKPVPGGFLPIWDAGGVAGGHAYRIVFDDIRREAFRVVNSWGRGWGDNGRAWITYENMRRLLAEDGEAVVVPR